MSLLPDGDPSVACRSRTSNIPSTRSGRRESTGDAESLTSQEPTTPLAAPALTRADSIVGDGEQVPSRAELALPFLFFFFFAIYPQHGIFPLLLVRRVLPKNAFNFVSPVTGSYEAPTTHAHLTQCVEALTRRQA